MLAKFTVGCGNYTKLKRLNQPRTEQINFNRRLNNAANKYQYSNPKQYKDLKATICSEPLPYTAYSLSTSLLPTKRP